MVTSVTGPYRIVRVMPKPPVELHVVSDATGETAARLVQALEAQFRTRSSSRSGIRASSRRRISTSR
jgi:regulator of PEP synthase PpsR (kinase-PPPase family)